MRRRSSTPPPLLRSDVAMVAPELLYVHVPFCSEDLPLLLVQRHVAVRRRRSRSVPRRRRPASSMALDAGRPLSLRTVYVGGGTPTVLDAGQLEPAARQSIRRRCDPPHIERVDGRDEPGDARSEDTGSAMKEAGVTRVSLGAQSMQERFLKRLGRTHTADDVRPVGRASCARPGSTRINVDLIYAQPEQTVVGLDARPRRRSRARRFSPLAVRADVRSRNAIRTRAGSRIDRREPTTHSRSRCSRLRRERLVGSRHRVVRDFELRDSGPRVRAQPHLLAERTLLRASDQERSAASTASRTMNARDVAEWQRRVETTGSGVAERDVAERPATPSSRRWRPVSGPAKASTSTCFDAPDRTRRDARRTGSRTLDDALARDGLSPTSGVRPRSILTASCLCRAVPLAARCRSFSSFLDGPTVKPGRLPACVDSA